MERIENEVRLHMTTRSHVYEKEPSWKAAEDELFRKPKESDWRPSKGGKGYIEWHQELGYVRYTATAMSLSPA
eukprot:scaffold490501_cov21-Prasinocladus_malaysianus.AAC.1